MENRKIKRISLDILKYYKLVTKSLNNCEFFEKSIEKKSRLLLLYICNF